MHNVEFKIFLIIVILLTSSQGYIVLDFYFILCMQVYCNLVDGSVM